MLQPGNQSSKHDAAAGGTEAETPNIAPRFRQVSSIEMPWFGEKSGENRL